MLLNHLSDYSQTRANGFHYSGFTILLPNPGVHLLYTFPPEFHPAVSIGHSSQSISPIQLEACHVYKPILSSPTGPLSCPIVCLNGDDVAILLLLFHFCCFKFENPCPAFHCDTQVVSEVLLSSYSRFHCLLLHDLLKCLLSVPFLNPHS